MVTRSWLSLILVSASTVYSMLTVPEAQALTDCRMVEDRLLDMMAEGAARLEQLDAAYSRYLSDKRMLERRMEHAGCLEPYHRDLSACDDLVSERESFSVTLRNLDYERIDLLSEQMKNPERAQLIRLLSAYNCGQHYDAVTSGNSRDDRRDRDGSNEKQPPFSISYPDHREDVWDPEIDFYPSYAQYYSTVCVRLCDGYFFPVSFATTENYFQLDATKCTDLCPAAETDLYVFRNPGGSIAESVSLLGIPYGFHSNAFVFREKYVSSCFCNLELPYREYEAYQSEEKEGTDTDPKRPSPDSHGMIRETESATITTGEGRFTIPTQP